MAEDPNKRLVPKHHVVLKGHYTPPGGGPNRPFTLHGDTHLDEAALRASLAVKAKKEGRGKRATKKFLALFDAGVFRYLSRFGLVMSLVAHVVALKISIATTVRTALNAGSGTAQCVEIQASNDALLAVVVLDAVPWTTPDAAGTISANITPPGLATVLVSGTANKGRLKNKDAVVQVTFAVGLSGSDINFDAVVWTVNGTITLSSLTYTPA